MIWRGLACSELGLCFGARERDQCREKFAAVGIRESSSCRRDLALCVGNIAATQARSTMVMGWRATGIVEALENKRVVTREPTSTES